MKIIRQHDIRDCGAACLSMIAAHYDLAIPVSKCRELTKTDRTGTNIYGIVDGADKLGLAAEALSGTPAALLDEIRKGAIIFPVIAHTISDGTVFHFIVLFSFENGKFLVGDPARGKMKISENEFLEQWTGYLITFRKTDRFHKEITKNNRFSKFMLLLQGQKKKIAGILLLSLVIASIGIAGAFVFQIMIDHFSADYGYVSEHEHTHDNKELVSETEEIETLIEDILNRISAAAGHNFNRIFIAVILLYLLQAAIQILRGWLIISFSKSIDLRLTLSYYNHITDLPVSSIAMWQTGEYLSRFSDSAAIRQAISGAALTLMLDSVMTFAGGFMLYIENRRLFFIACIMILLDASVVLIFRKPIAQNNQKLMENNAHLQSYFKESIDGMETIKAFGAENRVKKITGRKYHDFLNSVVKTSVLSLSQDTIADMIELVGTALILWMGFYMVLTEKTTIGALLTFYALLGYFTQPIKNLIELQPEIQTAVIAADRLSDILDLQAEQNELQTSEMPVVQTWELNNIDFRYGNRNRVLNNVSLSIKRGEKIAVIGESGSGKTTLAKLLLRFYSPEQGEILLNGSSIDNFELVSLRNAIGYVGQNTFLFADTIRNNLKLGNPDITDDEMKAICKMCRIDDYICSLPLGYDTPLEENGTDLSGGQRQKLSIARALLKKPQMLILDEATSNLDMISEEFVNHILFELKKEITCIIIAHRPSAVFGCDRIYVMEDGQIVESGTHDRLMQQSGKYAALLSGNIQLS